jgi:hypothetical protein
MMNFPITLFSGTSTASQIFGDDLNGLLKLCLTLALLSLGVGELLLTCLRCDVNVRIQEAASAIDSNIVLVLISRM